MQAVRAAANTCRYQPYNEDKGIGLLRHCLLRRGVVSGQVMVVLVTAQPVLPGAKNLSALCWPKPKSAMSRDHRGAELQPPPHQRGAGRRGKGALRQGIHSGYLCGKTYALSPRSFYQINHDQTEVLYGLAVEAARLTGKEVVLDAYCGIGTIGLTASGRAKQVVGVELNRDAVRDAIGNARHNDVKTPASLPPMPPSGSQKRRPPGREQMSFSWTRPAKAPPPGSSRAWPAWPPNGWSMSAAILRPWPVILPS